MAVACIIRLSRAVVLVDQPMVWTDEALYHSIAAGIARGEGFRSSGYDATPGWPFLLSLVYALFGPIPGYGRLLQAIVGSLVVAMTIVLTERLWGGRPAAIVGFLAALYPPLIYLSGVLYTENLFAAMLLGVALSLRSFNDRPSIRRAMVSGLCVGGTALSRALGLVLFPAISLVLAFFPRRTWSSRAAMLGGFLLGGTLVVLPWGIRNAHTLGHFVPVSTGVGVTLWRGNSEYSTGTTEDRFLYPDDPSSAIQLRRAKDVRALESLRDELARRSEYDADQLLLSRTVAHMLRQPRRSAALYVRKCKALFSPYSETQTRPRELGRIGTIVLFAVTFGLYVLVLGALFRARRRILECWPVVVPLLAVLGALPLLTTCTRYRLPCEPLLFVLAGGFFADRSQTSGQHE